MEEITLTEHVFESVIFIDPDNFKQINDTHGHSIGDQILKLAAKRLTETVRQPALVSRLGGDEFVIVSLFAEKKS